MFYDFLEIGCSDFETEIATIQPHQHGLSIEPARYYYDKLPNKKNCPKRNIAVGDYDGVATIRYVKPDFIERYNPPDWLKGCNSVEGTHELIANFLDEHKLPHEKAVAEESVYIHTLHNIIKVEGITQLYYLKIDTEGYDCRILNVFLNNTLPTDIVLPHFIQFETNSHTPDEEISDTVSRLESHGYDLEMKHYNTKMRLNLHKRPKIGRFHEEAIANYYIPWYPPNYNPTNLPHDNTLHSAQQYCLKHNYTGVTFENGTYEVRNGYYLTPHPTITDDSIKSWILY